MRESSVPVVKDLVLIGGGHTHVAVLRRFGMHPVAGVRLTLITRDVHTPYSGMLPGLVAGHYDFDDAHIDLAPLSRFAGARLYHRAAVGLDLDRRQVICDGRPPVPYDLLSINIGSTPSLREVPGAAGVAVPVKPISTFVARWERFRARVAAASGPVKVGVVGVGAGGVELVLAVQFALHRMLEEIGRPAETLEFHLFGASDTILPTHNRGMGRRLERVLRERGVQVHLGQAVKSVSDGAITCGDGTTVAVDEILWVTQAGAAPWLRETGLEVDESGFVCVGRHAAVHLAPGGLRGRGRRRGRQPSAREGGGVRGAAGAATGRQPAARAARAAAAAVSSAAPVSDAGVDRRSPCRRRAWAVVVRRGCDLALEGLDRPTVHVEVPRPAADGRRRDPRG